jgi:hypothetical protein
MFASCSSYSSRLRVSKVLFLKDEVFFTKSYENKISEQESNGDAAKRNNN